MLVLTVALLAMIALLATTFLVTARYDQVGVQGAMVSHQMEMLLSLVESDIRRKLAEDLWGHDIGYNGPGAPAHEGYDGPDTAHAWLRGVCGDLIEWEPTSGAPSYVQAVVTGDSSWQSLAGTQADGLNFRYAVLIQDLGGLVNVNVARQPDPDLVGAAYPVVPDTSHPENWPYTIWAFHMARGNADWGYWWWTGDKRYQWSTPIGYFAGFGETFRGGGPAQQVDLRYLLADPGELGRLDTFLRKYENLGREFDIQDELDLRYPGITYDGAPYPSVLQEAVPSLFSSSTGGNIPAYRRRLVTAVARTTGWVRRREPIYMHPYEDSFWTQTGLNKNLCDERWYFRFDGPHFDDLMKYLAEARMGFRISLQRGVTLSRMWPDDPYDIYYCRINPSVYGNDNFPPISPTADVPKTSPPFNYDEDLVEYAMRDVYPAVEGDYQYSHGPSLAVFLLSNTMAVMGVPSPDKDPEQAASYDPQPYAQLPAAKSARVKAYRELAAAFHLNAEDYQDVNGVPAILPGWGDNGGHREYYRFHNYGDWAAAEDRPYISEAVMEFEPWPDYCIIRENNYYGTYTLPVDRVDKNTGASTRGLVAGDTVTGVRVPPTTTWTSITMLSQLRTALLPVRPGGTIDLRVTRSGAGTVEVTAIPVEPALRTIAVEVYNPHDHALMMNDYGFYGSPKFRYNIAIPQQCDPATGKRAILVRNPLNNTLAPTLAARSCMLYVESRGVDYTAVGTWLTSHGITGVTYYPTNKASHYPANAVTGETANLVNLRSGDGEILMTIDKYTGNWRAFGYVADAVRNQPTFAAAPVLPSSGVNPGPPAGVVAAFAEARSRMSAGSAYPVVRLYRPLYMESRATQYMTAWDSWTAASGGYTPASRLGKRDTTEDDFGHPDSNDYRCVDARGFVVTTTNRSFRFGADVSRVTRLLQPRLYNTYGNRKDQENLWLDDRRFDSEDGPDVAAVAPTEQIDRQMRTMLDRVAALSGSKSLANPNVRQVLQKYEARLRFSPYTPTTPTERAECEAYYDFLDAFTMGGAANDNIDNNGNSYADEHGAQKFALGIPPELEENDPGGQWLVEHSNCWPAYGRINVNTAPREILEHCLMAPSDTVRQELGAAIYAERGGEASQSNAAYRPFTSLEDLYGRVSVLNGRTGGFDRFGFDGVDNHNGADKLPDMPPDPYGYIDDLDERNYLWRINSEILTVCSDTFAVYLRFQARRQVSGTQKIVAERRVYEVWDRANCLWPPKRRDGRLHTDFVAPQRIGIQVFGY